VRGGRKRGARAQAIGISRGGRTTKFHALADGQGRPLAFHPTGGQAADCRAAEMLPGDLTPGTIVLADRAYDTNAVRARIEAQGATPNIPSRVNRRWQSCFNPVLYQGRNAIERMFGRLKDFRRVATRYDKLAANYLAALHIAAIITFCI